MGIIGSYCRRRRHGLLYFYGALREKGAGGATRLTFDCMLADVMVMTSLIDLSRGRGSVFLISHTHTIV